MRMVSDCTQEKGHADICDILSNYNVESNFKMRAYYDEVRGYTPWPAIIEQSNKA